MRCETCSSHVQKLEENPWESWGCDHPKHSGKNKFDIKDKAIGCATALTCEYALCKECYYTEMENRVYEVENNQTEVDSYYSLICTEAQRQGAGYKARTID